MTFASHFSFRSGLAVALLATLLSASPVGPADAAQPSLPDPAELVVDEAGLARLVVQYRPGVVGAALLEELTDLDVTRAIELSSINAVAVTGPPAILAGVLDDSRVVGAHQQRRLELHLYASKEQVNAHGIEESETTTATFGGAEREVERPGVTGAGVVVGVMDSGIFSPHPDFGSRVTTGLHFAFSEIQDSGGISYEQWDPYAETTGVLALQDEIGHGTHVAGIIGGDGTAAAQAGGRSVVGIAPAAEFVSIKVADAPFGLVDDIDWEEAALAGFDYIIRHPELGIRVVNNSWGLLPHEPDCLGAGCGEPTDFDAMAEMFQAVIDAGVTLVFSAGNAGPDHGTIGGYHRAGVAIIVAAACKAVDGCPPGQVTSFSSMGAEDGTGPQVDVTAPGDNILAALSPSVLVPLTTCPDSTDIGYYCHSGTSMSAPHVTGIVALMYEANPDLTPAQVKECLTSTAVDMVAPADAEPDTEPAKLQVGKDFPSGHGMVDARAAVTCATVAGLPVTPVDPPGDGDVDGDGSPGPTPVTGGGLVLAALGLLAAGRTLGRSRRSA